MTYKEKTKLFCTSVLLIIKNATVIIPVLEGIIYTIIDLIHPTKKDTTDGTDIKE